MVSLTIKGPFFARLSYSIQEHCQKLNQPLHTVERPAPPPLSASLTPRLTGAIGDASPGPEPATHTSSRQQLSAHPVSPICQAEE